MPDLARTSPPEGYVDAWTFTAPVVDMPVYLRWLRARFDELGGTITRMSLAALPQTDDVVVNCAGSARAGWPVTSTYGRCGARWCCSTGIEVDRWWLDADGPTYVVSRADTVVVGGTVEDGDWSRTPSPETAASDPRPGCRARPGGRQGARRRPPRRPAPGPPGGPPRGRGPVVHCYGQGGAGVTVSWGCADEVTALVGELS